MKKIIKVALCFIFLFLVIGCHKAKMSKVEIDYRTSSIYSKEDMDSAIKLIKKEFSKWEGLKLHSIHYSSDEYCNEENIAWMNDLKANDNKEVFSQCIMFESDFYSSKHCDKGFNSDFEYINWQWWLARSKNGNWKLMTWGY